MADEDNNPLEDEDTFGLADGEDDLTKTLREQFEKGGKSDAGQDEDDAGLSAPLKEDDSAKVDPVSEDEGEKRLQKAKDAKPETEAKPKAEAEKSKDEKPESAPDTKAETEGEKPADKTPAEISDEDYAKAIEGMPENVRSRVRATQDRLDNIVKPLTARQAELDQLGTTVDGAVGFFLNLHDYAGRDPGGYLAWVVGEVSGDNQEAREAILKKAAEYHGYTLAKAEANPGGADDEDDPFMSDKERQQRDRIRELEAENAQFRNGGHRAPQIGPDSPGEVARRAVQNFISEIDDKGHPLHPHFDKLQPIMLNMFQQRGGGVTMESIREIYEQAELVHPETRQAALDRMIAAKSAAPSEKDVRQQAQKDAEATAKAKAASTKIIDGPGQGAGRQPATHDADVPLEQFLGNLYDKQMQ